MPGDELIWRPPPARRGLGARLRRPRPAGLLAALGLVLLGALTLTVLTAASPGRAGSHRVSPRAAARPAATTTATAADTAILPRSGPAVLTAPPPASGPGPVPPPAEVSVAASAAAAALTLPSGAFRPDPATGRWEVATGPGWWQSALILRSLTLFHERHRAPAPVFGALLDRLYAAGTDPRAPAGRRLYINIDNDDTARWGLAWLEAARYELTVRADVTRARRFLALAAADATAIDARPRRCDGPRWRAGMPPDTVSAAGFVALAAGVTRLAAAPGPLHDVTVAAHLTRSANEAFAWLTASGLIDLRTGLVRDALDGRCRPVGGPTNDAEAEVAQALTMLGRLTGDRARLAEARRFLAVILSPALGMTANGVLQQACEGQAGLCGDRPAAFNLPISKALTVQAIADWTTASGSHELDRVLAAQAAAVLARAAAPGRCTPAACVFGVYWSRTVPARAAPLPPSPASEAAALTALLAALPR